MKLKKIAVGLTALFVFGTSLSFANHNLYKQKKQYEQKLNSTKKAYEEVMQEIGEIESKIEEIDSQANELNQEIKKNEETIKKINEKISEKEDEIKKAEDEFEERRKLADERIRNMYMNGTENYIELILGFENFSDLISRIETVKTIMQFDINALDEINKGIEELNRKKQELEETKLKAEELKKENENKLLLIKEKKKEQEELVAQLEEKKQLYAEQMKEYRAKIYKIYNQIKAQAATKKKVVSATKSRGSVNFSSDEVVDYAMRFLGTPYVWGGTTPDGFDCSGYVRYVYAHFGVYLPRTSREQSQVGQTVSLDEAQPGDLVFFHNPVSHVGIYIGDGMYVHAPRTGDVVKVSSLSGRNITVIKRVR